MSRDQIRARLEGVTSGQWEHFPITGKTSGVRVGGKAGYAELDPRDAEFIANAPTDMARLLAALDAVEAICANADDTAITVADGEHVPVHLIRAAISAALEDGDNV